MKEKRMLFPVINPVKTGKNIKSLAMSILFDVTINELIVTDRIENEA